MKWEDRYEIVSLHEMQCQVIDRRNSEMLARLPKEEWQNTLPMPPTLVREEEALNECVPDAYRMVSRTPDSFHIWYTFERVTPPAKSTDRPSPPQTPG